MRTNLVNDFSFTDGSHTVTLMRFIEKALHKEKVPLLIIRLPTDSPLEKLEKLSCVKKVVVNREIDNRSILVALLRRDSDESHIGEANYKRQLQEAHSPGNDKKRLKVVATASSSSIPKVQDLTQFKYAYDSRSENDLWTRVMENLGSTSLRNCRSGLDRLKGVLIDATRSGKNDKEIYALLHHTLHAEVAMTEDFKRCNPKKVETCEADNSGRANNRVTQIQKVLPPGFKVTKMLDVGCAGTC